jgi:tRNA pseudouridine55 synthase
MRGRDAPVFAGPAYATARGRLVALVECDKGTLRPTRVFNLGR